MILLRRWNLKAAAAAVAASSNITYLNCDSSRSQAPVGPKWSQSVCLGGGALRGRRASRAVAVAGAVCLRLLASAVTNQKLHSPPQSS